MFYLIAYFSLIPISFSNVRSMCLFFMVREYILSTDDVNDDKPKPNHSNMPALLGDNNPSSHSPRPPPPSLSPTRARHRAKQISGTTHRYQAANGSPTKSVSAPSGMLNHQFNGSGLVGGSVAESIIHQEALHTVGLSLSELEVMREKDRTEKKKMGIPPGEYLEKRREKNIQNLVSIVNTGKEKRKNLMRNRINFRKMQVILIICF
jgi:hypothetical protein